jgi:hypothetical protein
MARIMPLFRREQSLAQFYIDIPALRPGTIGAYPLAFVSVGLATALRLAIDPYVHGLEFATFLPAVIITTLISGLGAGLSSVVLSVAAAAFFALPPRLSFYVDEPGDVLALLLYTVVIFSTWPSLPGCVLQSSADGTRRPCRQAKIVYSLPSMQPSSGGGRIKTWRDATVLVTVLPVGTIADSHENPRPQWIIPLSGRWYVETMDGVRVEMGPGEMSFGEDQNTVPRDGKKGHLSGTVGAEPAVLMVVQFDTVPIVASACRSR